MTDQEAFDAMCKHLLTMPNQAVDILADGERCRYRVDGMADGQRCVVGSLIPDSDYSNDLEGRSVTTVQRRVPCLRGIASSLLFVMQRVHDDPDNWEHGDIGSRSGKFTAHDELKGIAMEWDLTVPFAG